MSCRLSCSSIGDFADLIILNDHGLSELAAAFGCGIDKANSDDDSIAIKKNKAYP